MFRNTKQNINYHFINQYEHFNNIQNIVEHGVLMSVDTTNSESTSIQSSESTSITNTNTTNDTTNTNITDNSMVSNSNVQTNTNIDSSQNISNVNTVDNSSVQSINSSTNTYNVDNSQVINQTTLETTNELVQSCGMTIQEAQDAVNVVVDESVNTNIDASNTFIVTGNNNTISDVKLQSVLSYEGSTIDKSCALDSLNQLENDLQAANDNSKKMAGGVGGDTGATSGGNVTDIDNTAEKSDTVDGGVDAGQDSTQAATTTNENATENATVNDVTSDLVVDQTATTSASASAGGISFYSIILFIVLCLLFVYFN